MKETVLYESALVEIGVFAVDPNEPHFIETGYVQDPIIVFPKNSIWIQHEGSEPFVADTTLVNFYNSGQHYRRFAIHPAGDYCHWFRINDALLSEVVNQEQSHFSQENMPCPASVFLQHLQLLHDIHINEHLDSVVVDAQVLQLFHDLLSQAAVVSGQLRRPTARHLQLTERVKESLQADLSVNLSLQQLAHAHNTSPYHLSRVFKSVSGMGINQYRKQQRLRQLLLEMQQQSTDLVDLAFDFGFASHSHMSASFKQCFGLSPSQCRQSVTDA